MTNKLELILIPDFDSTRASMGYDEFDIECRDAVILEQESREKYIEIGDNEVFEIPVNFEAQINSTRKFYLISEDQDKDNLDDFLIEELFAGVYMFSANDNIFYALEKNDAYVNSDNEMLNDSQGENPIVEKMLDLITNSAKVSIDFKDFKKQFPFLNAKQAEKFLFMIINELASEDTIELIGLKLNNQLMMMGYGVEEESFTELLMEMKKELSLEIFAYQIACSNFQQKADPRAVYLQTEELLSKLRKK